MSRMLMSLVRTRLSESVNIKANGECVRSSHLSSVYQLFCILVRCIGVFFQRITFWISRIFYLVESTPFHLPLEYIRPWHYVLLKEMVEESW